VSEEFLNGTSAHYRTAKAFEVVDWLADLPQRNMAEAKIGAVDFIDSAEYVYSMADFNKMTSFDRPCQTSSIFLIQVAHGPFFCANLYISLFKLL